ncbi:hypothetical protein KC19_2G045600 [Ceratodon purpureus]|uniref:Amino acid transporter transmembrane domain-containing protein n=1 Tax=Ceratodon purpureus TaxID=3225 RepID=A0A8T0IS08_CERPU|nr:hypothetical protein KC19_2G045600 [Ceratodon purpureus]
MPSLRCKIGMSPQCGLFLCRQNGLIGGLLITIMIWSIEVAVLFLLIRTAEKYKTKSYQELVVATFGPSMAVLTSVTILAFLVGSLISYFIITGDVFQPIFSSWFGEDSLFANRRVVIVFFAMVVIFPLSLKRNIRDLRWSSTISVVMLTYLTVVVVALSISHLIREGLPEHVNYFEGGYHTFIALDVLVFAFHCHIQVMPIFAELADNPNPFFRKRLGEPLLNDEDIKAEEVLCQRKSLRVKRMDGIVIISMTTCLICYCLVGEFGYLLYPDVQSDVLISFGRSNHFLNFARVGMAAVSMANFPVSHYPCRSILDDGVRHILRGRIPEGFSVTLHIAITLFICSCALATALVTSDLGTVFSFIGSTGGVLVIFIIPGFILLRNKLGEVGVISHADTEALQSQEEARFGERLKTYLRLGCGILLVCFGCLIFFVTAYVNIFGIEVGSLSFFEEAASQRVKIGI